jgi:hypothetical protein
MLCPGRRSLQPPVITKNPSDFIGNVIGASEVQTKAILASTLGKVLIIDEAYMFSGSGHNGADVYKTAVCSGDSASLPLSLRANCL